MPWTHRDFDPIGPSGLDNFAFIFASALGSGETIAVASLAMTQVNSDAGVVDNSAQAHLIGAATVNAAPQVVNGTTYAAGTIVNQTVGGCMAGVRYALSCVATTSGGRALDPFAHVWCLAVSR